MVQEPEKVNSSMEDTELMERALEYAAESVGDIVPVILEEFYRREPGAEQVFKEFGFEDHRRMANSMVDEVLHCIISWVDGAEEVKSVISETVPHHRSLKIPDQLLLSMLDVSLEVFLSGIPADAQQERALLAQVGGDLRAEISRA